MPVGRILDGGGGHQFILSKSRLNELHQGHGIIANSGPGPVV
jgi:hypothetical protein